MEPIKVRILGHEYLLRAEEDATRALRVAEYVNEKLKEVQDNAEGLSEKKMAILVALNIASDYFQIVKEQEEMLADLRRKTDALISNIDSAMG